MDKRILLALAIVAVSLLLLAFGGGRLSGFFGLGTNSPDNNSVETASEKNSDANSKSTAIDAALSFSVLKKSVVSARFQALPATVPDCPETIDASLLVKNLGNAIVEALKIKPGSTMQFRACSGCEIERLNIGEEKNISLKLCRSLDQNNSIIVSAANAETIELKAS